MIQLTPALPSYFNSSNQLALMLQVSEAAPLSDLSAQRWNSHAKPLEQLFFLLSSFNQLHLHHLQRPYHSLTPLNCISSTDFYPLFVRASGRSSAEICSRGPSLPLMMVAHYCCYGNSLNFAVCADLLPLCFVEKQTN